MTATNEWTWKRTFLVSTLSDAAGVQHGFVLFSEDKWRALRCGEMTDPGSAPPLLLVDSYDERDEAELALQAAIALES